MPYFKGRGAQYNTPNKFLSRQVEKMHVEAIDEWVEENPKTIYMEEHAKTIVNKVDSPDIGMMYSMNPYQGCEHGCIYCFARNSFEYWGLSAGVDFETKIIVKKNAPELLEKFLKNPSWNGHSISLSGNTDCYQPAERKFKITRRILEICNSYNQPVSLISKNAGMLRDLDVLSEMGKKNQASVIVTITTLNESLRSVMEPRTTTASQRLKLIEQLSMAGVKAGVMVGPVIPGLNDHEMHDILKAAHNAGAGFSSYTFIRLNGAIQFLFHDWLIKNFPERADKVWNLIKQSHDGKVNDSRWGIRMKGEGPIADIIAMQYKKFSKIFKLDEEVKLDSSLFSPPGKQLSMF